MLGIHITVAVAWQRASSGDWAAYAAAISRRTRNGQRTANDMLTTGHGPGRPAPAARCRCPVIGRAQRHVTAIEGAAMHWSQMESSQPRLAELGRRRLINPGVLLVATIRADGTPRLSPVEPLVMAGDLWLCMMWHSTKARDLLRDPRVLVHNVITNRDGAEGELKIRGVARVEDERETQRRYAHAAAEHLGWSPKPGQFHLFAVDIAEVTVIRYNPDNGDQHVATWPPPHEFVRRATSDTSVGEPEPTSDILIAN